MSETAQEKAHRYATTTAIKRVEESIVREWWTVRKPGIEESIPVFFCPPQSHAEIMKNWPAYRNCGVLPA